MRILALAVAEVIVLDMALIHLQSWFDMAQLYNIQITTGETSQHSKTTLQIILSQT